MRILTWRGRREDELDEEIQTHLRMAIRDRMERGETREQAEAAARLEFGNVLQVKDVTRDMWGWTWLEQVLQDVRYALRQMRHSPGFAAVAILTLALCIGANTAIFSVVDAVLLRPLPYPHADRLVWLFGVALDDNFEEWAQRTHSYERFGLVAPGLGPGLLTGSPEPEKISYCEASKEFFELLGVRAARGRVFQASDFRPDSPSVMLVSSRFWRTKLGADPNFVGRTVTLDEQIYEVVGVLPDHHPLPNPVRRTTIDAWVPLRQARMVSAVALLRLGITPAQAARESDKIGVRIHIRGERQEEHHANVTAISRFLGDDARAVLWLVSGTVVMVLLIGCLNIANLSLARMTARRRELAVRSALGASRARLVRQMLTESLLLSLVGGTLGALLAAWLVPLLVRLSPYDVARIEEASIDGSALAFMLATAILTTLLFGLVPAWRFARVRVQADLKEGSRESTGTRADRTLRGGLAAAQIAISLVLLVGAGLLFRTFVYSLPVASGFDPHGKLVMRITMKPAVTESHTAQANFVRDSLERLHAVAGPHGASFVSTLPHIGMSWIPDIWVDNQRVAGMDTRTWAHCTAMTEGFFGQLKMRVMTGRALRAADDERAPRVAMVNQTMATRLLGGVSGAVGRRLEFEDGFGPGAQRSEVTIVGVVADTHGYNGLPSQPDRIQPELYIPWSQSCVSPEFLVVNTPGEVVKTSREVKRVIRSVDPNATVTDVQTLDQVFDRQVQRPRFHASLLGCMAALAFVLATIGIYGVINYSAQQREHEIGVRMALGARRSAVMSMMLRQALTVIAVGATGGLLAAAALTRLLTALLYRTKPLDPMTIGAATAILINVAVAASAIPAWRAAKADPLVALRHE